MTYIAQTRPARLAGRTRPTLEMIFNVWKQRRQLRTLDDRLLADIGISRTEARTEAHRPLWDVPSHWPR